MQEFLLASLIKLYAEYEFKNIRKIIGGVGMDAFLLAAGVDLFYNSTVQIAIAISVAIAALSYMFGSALSMPSLKGFARAELTELGVTAIIIILAILLATPGGVFDNVASGFAVQQGGVKFCEDWQKLHTENGQMTGNLAFGQADYFLGCRMSWDSILNLISVYQEKAGIMLPRLLGAYGRMMGIELGFGLLGNLQLGVSIPILEKYRIFLEIGSMPFVFANLIVELLTLLVDSVGTLMAAFAAQKMLLNFIEETMLAFILPFGLLLRAFPFSRKTGSTIVAVAFAAYFIYPITVLLNYQVYNMVMNPPKTPGCLDKGTACSADGECCSGDCRGVCVSPLTDFSEYGSVFSMCEGKTPAEIRQSLEALGKQQQDYQKQVIEGSIESTERGSKAQSRLETGFQEMQRESGLALEGTSALPWNWPEASFTIFELFLGDVGKFLVITALFVVVEIVITLTLMKDFALLIGGEPRLLGMGKLV